VEDLVNPDQSRWAERSVFVTGHTGFKGTWLTMWLQGLGAKVHGFALDPPTDPSLFEIAQSRSLLESDVRFDVTDLAALATQMKAAAPDVVFHLAAQPLVREGYRDAPRTFAVNTLGTAHVLEAVRRTETVKAVVVVTTDKVYEDIETGRGYRESDRLGGRDPYSASKAAAEIVAASYRSSYFIGDSGGRVQVATARAGNVVGGGDWAADRLVPDCLRAFQAGHPVRLRNPDSVRPWQHVLEPLSGYILLAERLQQSDGHAFASAWNFGPDTNDVTPTRGVAELTARLWGPDAQVVLDPPTDAYSETSCLALDSTRARSELGWRPRWSLEQALRETVIWHRAWMDGADMRRACQDQISSYQLQPPR
jgi:CDP-glucose 4,6-dehydratase